MDEKNYETLRIENQLCFPLYACSRDVIKRYKPFLDKIDLTYTQYITMLIMWERKEVNVKELGKRLYLDSGTLTPLLKKLESKGLLTRKRSTEDERNLVISITEKGERLRDEALEIPEKMAQTLPLDHEEAVTLYHILYKLLGDDSCPVSRKTP